MPKAHYIEAQLGESILSQAARQRDPRLKAAAALLYKVAFEEIPDLRAVTRSIERALESSGLELDAYQLFDEDPIITLEIRDEYIRRPDAYSGLQALQRLLEPRIPGTAIFFDQEGPGNRWDVQLSILGGFLSRRQIGAVSKAVTISGGRVTQVVQAPTMQADVFFVSVFARNKEARRQFLERLQRACNAVVSRQDLQRIPAP